MKLQVIIDKSPLGICTLLSSFFLYSPTYGQCEIEESRQVICKHDSSNLNYTEYVVRNKMQDTIYLWIDTDTVGDESLSLKQKNIWFFLKYIRAPKCELGLAFLCQDGSINFGKRYPPPPVLGCTFIKKILPDESFSIISLNENISKGDIHYVQKKTASHFFPIECMDEFCYDKPFIIVW